MFLGGKNPIYPARKNGGVLRYASPINQAADWNSESGTASGGAISRFITRCYRPIGTGNMSQLRILFRTWYLSGSAVIHSNDDIDILSAYVTVKETGVTRQVKFSNSFTATAAITSGSHLLSDALHPQDFGLRTFFKGLHIYITLMGRYDGTKLPVALFRSSVESSTVAGNDTLTWLNEGTGDVPLTSGTVYSGINIQGGVPVDLVGVYEDGDGLTVGGIGDSNTAGSNDNGSEFSGVIQPGQSFFGRALAGQVRRYNDMPEGINGCKIARIGGYIDIIRNNIPEIMSEMNYAPIWVVALGTNNFEDNYMDDNGISRNISLFNEGLDHMRAAYTETNGQIPFHLIGCKMPPRINNSASAADLAPINQVPFQSYGDGRMIEYNDNMDAQVGTKLDSVFDPAPLVRASQDKLDPLYTRWIKSGTDYNDGTHYGTYYSANLAASLRQHILAI